MGDAVGYLAAFLAENVLSTQKAPKAGCHGTRLPFKQLKRLKQENCLCPQVQHAWRSEILSLQSKAQVFLVSLKGQWPLSRDAIAKLPHVTITLSSFPEKGASIP